MQSLSSEQAQQVWTCLDNAFYVGQTDFRKTARCEVQNYILLALSVILCTVIGIKCEYSIPILFEQAETGCPMLCESHLMGFEDRCD